MVNWNRIHGRDYNKIDDIIGAQPKFIVKPPPINKEHYNLITKDITHGNKKEYK